MLVKLMSWSLGIALAAATAPAAKAPPAGTATAFDPKTDLVALHYDHAADRDDGQSAAADRTVLESLYGVDWIRTHVVPVSGAYGLNGRTFVSASDTVMDAVWGDVGWVAAHRSREQALETMTKRWSAILASGGAVWVKEGGQSDLTAEVVRRLLEADPKLDSLTRIHVVQHSGWNERQTTPSALAYTRAHTDYQRIRDGNRYLNRKGGDEAFVRAALASPRFAKDWKAAFAYYPPAKRLDFSDTCELFHILGLGELGLDAFRERFLAD